MTTSNLAEETDSQLGEFFLPPCEVERLPSALQTSGRRPILHLIRRDLERVYHAEKILWPVNDTPHGPPFLACSGILSGFDLLVRFFVSDQARSKQKIVKLGNGDRFARFLTKYARIRRADAEFLWAFRNALSHSYGIMLDGPKFAGVGVTLATGTQEAGWVTKKTVQRKGKKIRKFIVNMWELKDLFLKTVDRCESVARDRKNRAIRRRFRNRYSTHGFIFVASEVKKPGVPTSGES